MSRIFSLIVGLGLFHLSSYLVPMSKDSEGTLWCLVQSQAASCQVSATAYWYTQKKLSVPVCVPC